MNRKIYLLFLCFISFLLISCSRNDFDAPFSRGEEEITREEYDNAISFFEDALKIDPQNEKGLIYLEQTRNFKTGLEKYNEREVYEASKFFMKCVKEKNGSMRLKKRATDLLEEINSVEERYSYYKMSYMNAVDFTKKGEYKKANEILAKLLDDQDSNDFLADIRDEIQTLYQDNQANMKVQLSMKDSIQANSPKKKSKKKAKKDKKTNNKNAKAANNNSFANNSLATIREHLRMANLDDSAISDDELSAIYQSVIATSGDMNNVITQVASRLQVDPTNARNNYNGNISTDNEKEEPIIEPRKVINNSQEAVNLIGQYVGYSDDLVYQCSEAQTDSYGTFYEVHLCVKSWMSDTDTGLAVVYKVYADGSFVEKF